jgi:hypothetical protein
MLLALLLAALATWSDSEETESLMRLVGACVVVLVGGAVEEAVEESCSLAEAFRLL